MQEEWDNFMHVYIHLHSKSAPICAFVKTSMLVFLRNFTSSCFLLTFSVQSREGPLYPRQSGSHVLQPPARPSSRRDAL